MAQAKKIHDSLLSTGNDSVLSEKSIGSGFPAAKSIDENSSGDEEQYSEQITSDDEGSTENEPSENVSFKKRSSTKLSQTLQQNPTVPLKETEKPASSSICPQVIICLIAIAIAVAFIMCPNDSSLINKQIVDWRSTIKSYSNLSDDQRSTISASLKPILDKSIQREQRLSTLLILSVDENKAAQLARCLLQMINTVQSRDQISTELNFEQYGNNKLQLDKDLETLLKPDDSIRAVVLRRIDRLSQLNALEQLRLLFAYCDGENPKISDRLIIMTAASSPPLESRVREEFKSHWPKEHDFIDALMSRISGHTLQITQEQTLVCN